MFPDADYVDPVHCATKDDLLKSDLDEKYVLSRGCRCMDFLVYENVGSIFDDINSVVCPTFCEVLRENVPCKLYFDIEEVLPMAPGTLHNWLYKNFDPVYDAIKRMLPTQDTECIVLSNCREVDTGYKMSFHIVFPMLVFQDQVRVNDFIQSMQSAGLILPRCIDMTVYKKFQLFRVLGCYKQFGDDFPLEIVSTRYSLDLSNCSERDQLKASLLTNIGDCEIIEDSHTTLSSCTDEPEVSMDTLPFEENSLFHVSGPTRFASELPVVDVTTVDTLEDQVEDLTNQGLITPIESMCIIQTVNVISKHYQINMNRLIYHLSHSTSAHHITLESKLSSHEICPVHARVHEGRNSRDNPPCTFSFDFVTMSYSVRCVVGGKVSGIVYSTGRHVIDRLRPNKRELWGIRNRNFLTAFVNQIKNPPQWQTRFCEELSWHALKRGGRMYTFDSYEKLWVDRTNIKTVIGNVIRDKFRCHTRRQIVLQCDHCIKKGVVYYSCENGTLAGSCFEFIKDGHLSKMRGEVDNERIFHVKMERNEFNADLFTLPVADQQVVDLRTGLLHPRTGSHLYSQSLPHKILPFDHKDVKEVHQLLQDAFTDETHFRLFYLSLGSMLFGDTDYERCFYIWLGVGRNSKSVIAEFLQEALLTGFLYASTTPSTFIKDSTNNSNSHAANLLSLAGARVVTVPEFVSTDQIDTAKIKMLSSGDMTSGRQMYTSTQQYFKARCSIIIHTNEVPHFGSDKAIIDRIRLVKFPVRFVMEPDPNNPNEKKAAPDLIRRIKDNPSAILTCLVYYAKTYFLQYRSLGRTLHEDWPDELKAQIEEELIDNILEAAFDVGLIEKTDFEMEFTDKNYLLQVLEDFAKKRSLRFHRADLINSLSALDCRTKRKSCRIETEVIKKTVITNLRITNSFMKPQQTGEGDLCVGKYQVSRNMIEAVGQQLKTKFSVSWKQKFEAWIVTQTEKKTISSAPGCILVDRKPVEFDSNNSWF
jgi:hypothetical protein